MKRILTIALLLTWVSGGYGEPSPAIKHLMNEPVTMLDWGMYRLSRYLEGIEYTHMKVPSVGPMVEYDREQGRIWVTVAGFPNEDQRPRKACRETINQLRFQLGIDPETGWDVWGKNYSTQLLLKFTSASPDKAISDSLALDLTHHTYIRVVIVRDDTDMSSPDCWGAVMSNTISFK